MLKRLSKLLIISAAIGLTLATKPYNVSAAPAYGEPINAKQPSGQTFKIKLHGDDKFNWVTSETGEVIMKGTDGYWYYAELSNDKVKTSSVKYIVETKPKNSLDEKKLIEWKKSATEVPKEMRAQSVERTEDIKAASVGTSRNLLVVLVDFTNVATRYSELDWYNTFFGANTNSVNDYYKQQSNGKFSFAQAGENYNTNDGIVKVKLNYIHPNTYSKAWNETRVLNDVIQASSKNVDYRQFDLNGDGRITSQELDITLVIAGNEESFGGPAPNVWGHMSNLPSISVQGKTLVNNYSEQGEIHGDHKATVGIFCHELGHTLGLPDLYDYDNSSLGVGNHSVMGGGSWGGYPLIGSKPTNMDAWSKVQLSFVSPTIVKANGNFKLNSNYNNYNVLKVLTSNPNEYFLVENRQFNNYDQSLSSSVSSGGIAVWHIDDQVALKGYAINDDESHKGVDIEEASIATLGYSHLDRKSSTYNKYDDYFHAGGVTAFGTNTNPNSRMYNGSNSNVVISTNSAPSTEMNVTVELSGAIIDDGDDTDTTLKMIGAIERPYNYENVYGNFPISGWALSGKSISKVEVLVDGYVYGNANLNWNREDIFNKYPAYNNHNGGFYYYLDTTRLYNGYHTVSVRAYDNENNQLVLGSVYMYVGNR